MVLSKFVELVLHGHLGVNKVLVNLLCSRINRFSVHKMTEESTSRVDCKSLGTITIILIKLLGLLVYLFQTFPVVIKQVIQPPGGPDEFAFLNNLAIFDNWVNVDVHEELEALTNRVFRTLGFIEQLPGANHPD